MLAQRRAIPPLGSKVHETRRGLVPKEKKGFSEIEFVLSNDKKNTSYYFSIVMPVPMAQDAYLHMYVEGLKTCLSWKTRMNWK